MERPTGGISSSRPFPILEAVESTSPYTGSFEERRVMAMFAKGLQEWNEKMPILEEMKELQEWMDRLFKGMIQDYQQFGAASPRIDFSQDEASYLIRAELPGVSANDIDLSIEGNSLVIRGERRSMQESKDERYHYRERVYGGFYREVPLPSGASSEDVRAELKDGILTVRIKKSESRKPSIIKVKAEALPGTRESYRKRIESEIAEWTSRLAELRAKAGEKSQELRKKYREEVDALEDRLEEVKYRVSNLVAASEEAWETMKARLEETMEDLKERFRRIRR